MWDKDGQSSHRSAEEGEVEGSRNRKRLGLEAIEEVAGGKFERETAGTHEVEGREQEDEEAEHERLRRLHRRGKEIKEGDDNGGSYG